MHSNQKAILKEDLSKFNEHLIFYFEEVKDKVLEQVDLNFICARWAIDLSPINDESAPFHKLKLLFRSLIKVDGVDNFIRKLKTFIMEFTKKFYTLARDYTWS